MKKILLLLLGLSAISTTFAAVAPLSSLQIGLTPLKGYVLQTNGTTSTWVATSSLGFISGTAVNAPVLAGNGSSIIAATTTGTGDIVVLSGSPTLTLPSISGIQVSGGIMGLPTGSSDTLVGKATTDIFTNKTYDTAGTGNVFKINGNQITAVTGSGSTVALSTSPVFTGTSTFTDIRLNGGFYDSTNSLGTLGKVLWSTGTSTLWVATSSLGFSGGTTYTGTYPIIITGSVISTGFSTSTTNIFSALNTFTATTTFASSTFNGNIAIGTTTTAGYSSTNPSRIFIDNTGNSSSEGLTELSNLNGFFETQTVNVSNGANAQACKSVTNNLGSLTSSFGALCINSSGFANPQVYNVGGANDVSLMALTGGNLIINNASTTGSINFITGGVSTTTNTWMSILANGNIGIGSTTPSSTLDVKGTSTTNIFTVSSSTGVSLFKIDNTGLITQATTTFTASTTFAGLVKINNALTIAGALSGVTTLAMGGALSGVTTAALSNTLTQTMTALATSTAATIRGLYLLNSTAATISQNQQSPAIELEGKVWSGSASVPSNWRIQNTFPATSTPNATSSLTFSHSLNNAGTTTLLSLLSGGMVNIATTTNTLYGLTVATTSLFTGNSFFSAKTAFGTTTAQTYGFTVATTSQFINGIITNVTGYTSASTITMDIGSITNGGLATTTVNQATTFANPTGTFRDGDLFELRVLATTTQTVTWGTVFASSTDLSNVASVASGTTRFIFEYDINRAKLDLVGKLGAFNP